MVQLMRRNPSGKVMRNSLVTGVLGGKAKIAYLVLFPSPAKMKQLLVQTVIKPTQTLRKEG